MVLNSEIPGYLNQQPSFKEQVVLKKKKKSDGDLKYLLHV